MQIGIKQYKKKLFSITNLKVHNFVDSKLYLTFFVC
jgi:hypothetical protein